MLLRPALHVIAQSLQSLFLQLNRAISHAFALANGQRSVCQIHVRERQAAQSTDSDAGLEKHLENRVVAGVAAY
jgi:hypothetical protein